jgi:beta-galactosidase
MFDFGADGRNEGGESGQNHKGLVTFDRKYKKDSFYAYKAWLSDEPFVHLCGKRYVDRTEDVTKVTVYSNLPSVELFANGISLGVKEAPDHFFYFDVPNVGETKLVAVAGQYKDESVIRKVAEPNPAYRLVEKGAILNWWDITEVPGYASLNTKVEKIIASIGVDTLTEMLRPIVQMSAVPSVIALLSTMTVIRQINLLTGATNTPVTKEQLLDLNAQLNKIAIE